MLGTGKDPQGDSQAGAADTDIIGASTSFYYWGATGSDGSWRMGLSGGNMVIQKRESGSWVTKSTVTP